MSASAEVAGGGFAVDVGGGHRLIDEDQHAVAAGGVLGAGERGDLQEALPDRHHAVVVLGLVRQHARAQRRHQRHVARQDAELAELAGRGHLFDVGVDQRALAAW